MWTNTVCLQIGGLQTEDRKGTIMHDMEVYIVSLSLPIGLPKATRTETIQARKEAHEAQLPQLNTVLREHGGEISHNMLIIGIVAVHTTANGAKALAALPCVQAVQKDQLVELLF